MGGQSKLTPNSFNGICARWVNGFLNDRCMVRQNRWEYVGDLYAAYQDYAKKNSGQGYDLSLTRQRFSRVLTAVFAENKWFMEKIATPDGSKRVRVGLCLKEHSTVRSPEHLYPSMNKETRKAELAKAKAAKQAAREADWEAGKKNLQAFNEFKEGIKSPHFNPDSADRANEAPGKSQAERDKVAQALWDKG